LVSLTVKLRKYLDSSRIGQVSFVQVLGVDKIWSTFRTLDNVLIQF
jgi:hypothetical protein